MHTGSYQSCPFCTEEMVACMLPPCVQLHCFSKVTSHREGEFMWPFPSGRPCNQVIIQRPWMGPEHSPTFPPYMFYMAVTLHINVQAVLISEVTTSTVLNSYILINLLRLICLNGCNSSRDCTLHHLENPKHTYSESCSSVISLFISVFL